MNIVKLIQGSAEWHEHRRTHRGTSQNDPKQSYPHVQSRRSQTRAPGETQRVAPADAAA